jgi:hypothetical protein
MITNPVEAYRIGDPKTFTGIFQRFGRGILGDSALLAQDLEDGEGNPFRGHSWVQDVPWVEEPLVEGSAIRFDARVYTYLSDGQEKQGLLYAGGLSWSDGTPIRVNSHRPRPQHGVQLLERKLLVKEAKAEESLTCKRCGETWTRTRRMGRKPLLCPSCQRGERAPVKAPPAPTTARRAAAIGQAIIAVAEFPDLVALLRDALDDGGDD